MYIVGRLTASADEFAPLSPIVFPDNDARNIREDIERNLQLGKEGCT